MIGLTCRTGETCRIDPTAIQRVESTPDTVVFLVDGSHVAVTESVAQVALRVRDARAGDIVACYELDRGGVVAPRALQDMLSEIAESRSCPVAGQRY
ncbi:flagellar FlbD family protein [Trujillonella endophytica]|uniref:Flagellar protein FlbD n=1 Tax=Trujillonella endophytica TaxID=673521 RepID=A0A1H8UUH6_9ACTN|nr:flagellar FlbD family protein [Trujillella endophytica]SEP06862.1 flagellar protein FlbD [Trujillella endophytica]